MSLIRDRSYFITSLIYLGMTVLSLATMIVYYAVDHGLRDMRMTLLFLPCIVAAILFFLLNLFIKSSGSLWTLFFHMGFASAYLYLLLSAIVAMANCENAHLLYFLFVGASLLVASLVCLIIDWAKRRNAKINPIRK